MKKPICLTEQDLTLLHYGETPQSLDRSRASQHLAGCPACRDRLQRLAHDLEFLPVNEPDFGPHSASRMASRVIDRLPRRRRLLPVMAGAFSAVVIVFAANFWTTRPEPVLHNASIKQSPMIEQVALPDVDLLENLDLLKELDTLSDIVGV
jgi:hypothetical protein